MGVVGSSVVGSSGAGVVVMDSVRVAASVSGSTGVLAVSTPAGSSGAGVVVMDSVRVAPAVVGVGVAVEEVGGGAAVVVGATGAAPVGAGGGDVTAAGGAVGPAVVVEGAVGVADVAVVGSATLPVAPPHATAMIAAVAADATGRHRTTGRYRVRIGSLGGLGPSVGRLPFTATALTGTWAAGSRPVGGSGSCAGIQTRVCPGRR